MGVVIPINRKHSKFMQVYFGWRRTTAKTKLVEQTCLAIGVGQMNCEECHGTRFFEYSDGTKDTCVRCKGQGYTWVSI